MESPEHLAKRAAKARERLVLLKADPEKYAEFRARQNALRLSPEIKERVRVYRRKFAQTEKGRQQNCLHQRRVRLKKRGLTLDSYDQMLAAQGGRCAICKTDKPARGGGNYSFPVD